MFGQILVFSALLVSPLVAQAVVTTTVVPTTAGAGAGDATTPAGAGDATTATATLRCSDDAGNLLPSAQSCSDEAADCASVFKTAAVASPASRDPQCDLPIMADLALKCSKTCAICCENPNYSCGDAKGYETLCPTWKNTCASDNAQVRDMMAKICPGTCGLCAQSSCKDSLPNCPEMVILCNDIDYHTLMEQQCARTCGTCTNTGASAPGPGPAPGPSTGVCADSRNCAEFVKNGFCTNTWYPLEVRKKTCGKLCGWC